MMKKNISLMIALLLVITLSLYAVSHATPVPSHVSLTTTTSNKIKCIAFGKRTCQANPHCTYFQLLNLCSPNTIKAHARYRTYVKKPTKLNQIALRTYAQNAPPVAPAPDTSPCYSTAKDQCKLPSCKWVTDIQMCRPVNDV